MNGAVNGEMMSHIKKPFLCRGARFSRRECRCEMGALHTDDG